VIVWDTSTRKVPLKQKITLEYAPRSYQLDLLKSMQAGVRMAVCVWHRRAGKDMTAFNWTITEAIRQAGVYYIFYPTYAQGKKILWNGIDATGKKFIDYVPEQLVISKNETDMSIKVRTHDDREALIQVIGTDKMDSIVGTNPRGCVFSEFSLQNPRGWDLMRPVLRENLGWAIFIYTPRGRNHGWRLYERAQGRPGWFTSLKTVNDTIRDSEVDKQQGRYLKPVVDEADLQEELETGMDPDLIQQEYFCSFQGALQGAYFGHLVEQARKDGRLERCPWNPDKGVITGWDIGIGDDTAIWFAQSRGRGVDLIDYDVASGKGLDYYVKLLKEKPYAYDLHILPHDVSAREWITGQKRVEALRKSLASSFGGSQRVKIAKKLPIDEQIDLTRRFFGRFNFDFLKTGPGIDALASYTKDWDEKHETWKDKPLHNWATHGASALMTLVIGYEDTSSTNRPRQTKMAAEFDEMNYENDKRRPRTYNSDFDPLGG